MNNKNSAKQKKLIEAQRLKKKKLLLQMKNEIKTLENELNHIKFNNSKIIRLKNLKISVKFIQRVAPYVLTAGLVAGGYKLAGCGFPFYNGDTFKANLNIMKEFDNLGNIRYEQQYSDYENSNNIFYYYYQWQQDVDGFYSRNVETYKLDDLTEEAILSLFNQEDLNLYNVLGEPISVKKEIKNNVTEEELQQQHYLRAVIYSENKDDYIIHKETNEYNLTITIIYLMLTILVETIPAYIRKEITKFDFGACVRKIEREHPTIDTEDLIKKLEIKKSNYKKLTRR